jgi:hypothetical protein
MAGLARKLAARWPAQLRPGSWPVRWRLAGVSAGLTLVILLVFGAVIGQVATSRIRDDFNREVSGAAQSLAAEIRVASTPLGTLYRGPNLDDFVRPDGASARVFAASGENLSLVHQPRAFPPTAACGWPPPGSPAKPG